MLRSIPGLEAVEVERFGYAVEYDYALPTQLSRSLETRLYRGLFFAGQLNGTSGYEEAAVQGLLAGINAARLVQGRLPLILQRHEAHAAVLIDELTTHGVDEPFRMMTSRSEHRLRLREGTAGWRLTPHGFEVGLVSPAELQRTLQHRSAVEGELARLDARGHLARLRVPMATWATVTEGDISRPVLSDEVIEAVEIEAKYAPYIEQADEALERQGSAFARLRVPPGFDFSSIVGLSNEARERLAKAQPATFEDVQRLRGITPASAALVLAHLRRAVSRETGTCVSRRPNVAEAL
jgi:tRNA uridine 5-carboxymethylaminomethyl modification enzyme